MPIYTYKCKKCNKVFEYEQKITDEPLQFCPEDICAFKSQERGEVERIISKNVGLIFKGSGFYITDYSNKSSD